MITNKIIIIIINFPLQNSTASVPYWNCAYSIQTCSINTMQSGPTWLAQYLSTERKLNNFKTVTDRDKINYTTVQIFT